MRRTRLGAIVIAATLLVPGVLASSDGGVSQDGSVEFSVSPNLDVRGSILIESEADFTAENGVRSGNGTADDPYVIKNWMIVKDQAFGIRLVDTDAHVVFRNVSMDGREGEVSQRFRCIEQTLTGEGRCDFRAGIQIFGAENVTLDRVRVLTEPTTAVEIRDAAYIEILSSKFAIEITEDPPMGTTTEGIDAKNVRDLQIENTTISNAASAMFLSDVHDAMIRQSTFVGGPQTMPFAEVSNLTFARNRIEDINVFVSETSPNVSFVRNSFSGGPHSIQTTGTGVFDDLTVCGNRFANTTSSDPDNDAIEAFHAHRAVVEGNVFENTSKALEMQQSRNVTMRRNVVTNSPGLGFGDRVVQFAARFDGPAEIHQNIFENNSGEVHLAGPADATFNWWGAPDGPSGAHNGSGQELDISETSGNVSFDPWLTSRPAVGPDSVSCSVGPGPKGALEEPGVSIFGRISIAMTFEETVGPTHAKVHENAKGGSFHAKVDQDVKLGPYHVQASVNESVSRSVGPIEVSS